MNSDVKSAFAEAVESSLLILRPLLSHLVEPTLVWTKQNGQWQGETKDLPSYMKASVSASRELRSVADTFTELFRSFHPEHSGMVGFGRFGQFNLGSQAHSIPERAIVRLLKEFADLNVPKEAISRLADEFEQFIDMPKHRFRFQAVLINFSMDVDKLDLPGGLQIRRLTEAEFSDYYGGPLEWAALRSGSSFSGSEFVIEGFFEESKRLATLEPERTPDSVRTLLTRAVLCLRTFKSGRVGYDTVHFAPTSFCPILVHSFQYGDLYIPFGIYHLSATELIELADFSTVFFSMNETGIQMACSRLSDAEIRVADHDRIVDSIIGMEAILLGGLSKEDRKGELKFRFSLHYSTLFRSSVERHRAFKVAKDLYDLRSTIAHGSIPSEVVRIGEARVNLAEAANKATDALRHVIKHFLPLAASSTYKKPEFWERSYFGLPEASL